MIQTSKNTKGWTETVTTEIVIEKFGQEMANTAGDWVKFGTKYPSMYTKGRHHCQCCGIPWEKAEPEMKTYLVFTNDGNRIICETCNNYFKKNGKSNNQGNSKGHKR